MDLISKYVTRRDYENYEDFHSNFELNIPESFNFGYDIVDFYAENQPSKKAIVYTNDIGEHRIITFSELKVLSDKTCNFLSSIGISKGDFVMTMLKRKYHYWIVATALHKLGAVLVPATHLLTEKDIQYRVESADIKMVFCAPDKDIISSLLNVKKRCKGLKHLATLEDADGFFNYQKEMENASSSFKKVTNISNNDYFIMYFTSGTTGYPKMVLHNQIYPLAHICTAKYWQKCEDGGLHFTLADTGWGKASWGKIYGQWISGSTVFVYDYDGKFEPTDLLPLIEKHKVTTFCAPPTVYRFLMKADLSKYNFSSLQHLCTAGEALNPEVYKKILEYTGLKIFEGFGQTETTCLLATLCGMQVKTGSMGRPIPIYAVKLLDRDGNEPMTGDDGEICIDMNSKNPGLTLGYYKNPEKTAEVIHDGYYHTGDLAYKDEDGYFWFVGRKDDIIKSSGYRIGPFEVESAVMEHPSVLECAITGEPDELRGQVVKATIVLANGFTPSDELKKEIQNHVKKATAPYKYPRIIDFVDVLPKTISGKIRRVEIREKK